MDNNTNTNTDSSLTVKPISLDKALNPRSALHGKAFQPSGKFEDYLDCTYYVDHTTDMVFVKLTYFDPRAGHKAGLIIPVDKETFFDPEFVVQPGTPYKSVRKR